MTAIAVVNLGNTSTAAGLWRAGRLVFTKRIPTGRMGRSRLFAGARRADLSGLAMIAVASVVPAREAQLKAALRRELGLAPRFLGRDLKAPLKVRVKQPARVGADRLAAALAAHRRFGAAVIVDFGTAVTVNAVSAAGEFLGGAILPGVELAARALASGTAKVKVTPPRRAAPPPGRSTEAAVSAGLLYGLAGAVDRLVAETRSALGGRARLVATGGGAGLVAPLCRAKLQVLPNLVLEGLALAAEAARE